MVPADTRWYTATFDNPTIPPGNTGWRFYRGKKYQVTDPNILVGKPAFVSKNNAGTVYLADFVIEEYDEDGDYLGKVCEGEISTLDGWFYWSADGSGRMRLGKGKNGHRAIKISGTRDDANASNNNYRFSVTPGHSYTISGYMKGVRVSRGATCRLRIDFETSPTRGELHYKNKEYLNHRLQPFIEFGRTNNVPLYLGEFGLYRDCFLAEKGGLNWVRDMVELMNKYGLSYTYHAYHEYSFGIYQDGACLPSDATANKGLIELFSMINSE